ncbi:ADP-forming succinate--CoA ligase subunit beta [Candidatus Woesearchaeota archaeon]|nr:ADP-forming succinate--CoA ligase subunit beta [Candidatus Woesearchaeota archaeon]
MRLKEYQGKELFKKYGIKVPSGYVISSINHVKEQPGIVKAQLPIGSRGKSGGIKTADSDNIKEICSQLFKTKIKGLKVKELLIEEKLDIEKELYLSITVNQTDKCLTLIFSEQGGINIESVPEDNIIKINFFKFDEIIEEIKSTINDKKIIEISKNIYNLMRDFDAELVEINPLVLSKGEYIAADSKVIIDDNALYRHPEFSNEKQQSDIERKASEYGLQYVELDGDIAIIGNGAGLVMATLDSIKHFGGSAANFLDLGGGASVERMEKALEIALMKKTKAIFINVFGGITRCDDIAQGLVNYIKKNNINIPIVVRIIGTNQEKAELILKENNIESFNSMDECSKRIVKTAK